MAANSAKLQKYNELADRAKQLLPGDDEGLKELIAAAVDARLSDTQIDSLIAVAARTTKVKTQTARGFVQRAREELKRRDDSSPKAKADRKTAEEAAETVRKGEIAALYGRVKAIAEDPKMLAGLESFVHRLGVIGEEASIRGTYIAGSSRLSRDTAISYLRRGASSSGKNHPLLKILRLFPAEDVIVISSATPQALIYEGADADDRDALKHRIILIGEAAVISRKSNGDEHPMAAMIRTLLSDGKLDHRIPVPQPGGTPKTVHIQRDGPVCLMLTSARDDVEAELLTRLMCSDADESDEQTNLVAAYGWAGRRAKVTVEEIERWVDFQRWLIASMPPGGYVVAVPFSDAIKEAHLRLMNNNPGARQLRIRRDVVSFRAAIEASAILHKAQRRTDAGGSIIATLDDYRHAHDAFDLGMASLYDIKHSRVLPAALAAAIEIVHEQAEKDGNAYDPGQSYKIGVSHLRKKLGINSNWTAQSRIEKLLELGALEEDEENRGKGRGRGATRFYWIRKENLDDAAVGNVFPTIEMVEQILREKEGAGPHPIGQSAKTSQPIDTVSESALSDDYPLGQSEDGVRSSDVLSDRTIGGQSELSHDDKNLAAKNSLSDRMGSRSGGNGAKKPENALKSSGLTAEEAYAATLGAGGKLPLWSDGGDFDVDLRAVDRLLADRLLASLEAHHGKILGS